MEISKIGWTDYSGGIWNVVTGCTPAGPGCANCYARRIYERFGRDFSQVTWHPKKFAAWHTARLPEHSPKRGAPHRPMVFPVDTGDWCHEDILDRYRVAMLLRATHCPHAVFQFLTKRPMEMLRVVESLWNHLGASRWWPIPNVWLGVSVSTQAEAYERIPPLLATPAAIRFVSVEPMLEDISLWGWLPEIDWVICGAESGPSRRPFDKTWAWDLWQECANEGVAFFGKQDSGLYPGVPLLLCDNQEIKHWPDEMDPRS